MAAPTEEEDREQWVLLSEDHLSGDAYLGDAVDVNTEGVSRTLTNQEVRADLARWIEPITTEVHQLSVVKEAIYRMSAEEAKQFMREHPGAILYPAKGVFVAKASGKLRARGVICGNYVGEAAGGESNYTEQVDATAVRVVLRLGALNNMQFRSTDVSVAFLTRHRHGARHPMQSSIHLCGRRSLPEGRGLAYPQSTLWTQTEPKVLGNSKG